MSSLYLDKILDCNYPKLQWLVVKVLESQAYWKTLLESKEPIFYLLFKISFLSNFNTFCN